MRKKVQSILYLFLTFFAGAAISYLIDLFDGLERIVFIACAIVIVILVVMIVVQRISEYRRVRYAVIIFLLNDKDELLLVRNQTHKILLPPCKTMFAYELPHQAIKRVLKSQVGLEENDYCMDERFYTEDMRYYRVLNCPPPFATQQEFSTKQSGSIQYHYSFIYICKIKDGVNIRRDTDYFPQFYTIDEIKQIEATLQPFQDIVQRYETILKRISGGST